MDRRAKPTVEEIEDAFLELLNNGGLDEPDEVRPDAEAGEVTFLWHEQRLAVVVGPDGPRESYSDGSGSRR